MVSEMEGEFEKKVRDFVFHSSYDGVELEYL